MFMVDRHDECDLDLLRLESSNMQVSNSVLKLEEFHGFEKK